MQEPPVRKVYNMGAEFQIRYHPSYPTSQLVLRDLQSTKLHYEKNFITWNFAGKIEHAFAILLPDFTKKSHKYV